MYDRLGRTPDKDYFFLVSRAVLDKKRGIFAVSEDLFDKREKTNLLRFIQKTILDRKEDEYVAKVAKHYVLILVDNDRWPEAIPDKRVAPVQIRTKPFMSMDTVEEFVCELKKLKTKINSVKNTYCRKTGIAMKDLGCIVYYPNLISHVAKADYLAIVNGSRIYDVVKDIFAAETVISIQDNSVYRAFGQRHAGPDDWMDDFEYRRKKKHHHKKDEDDESSDETDDDVTDDEDTSEEEGSEEEDTTEEETLPDGITTEYDSEEEAAAAAALDEAVEAGEADLIFTEAALLAATSGDTNYEYGSYLGVYNVTGEAGEMILASPTAVDDYTDYAVVMHYNATADSWEQVENVQIMDNHVYATFDSLSPVAVYTANRKVDIEEAGNITYIVLNGIPGTIDAGDEENTVTVTDYYGRQYTYNTAEMDVSVVGGYWNEVKDLDTVSITMNGGNLVTVVFGSVLYGNGEESCHVTNANFVMNGGNISSATSSGYGRVIVENASATFNGGVVTYPSAGVRAVVSSLFNDSVNPEEPNEDTAVGYVVNANVYLMGATDTSYCYVGGASGYCYTKNATLVMRDGTAACVAPQSNGHVDNFKVSIYDGHLVELVHGARGSVDKAETYIYGGTVDTCWVGCEDEDNGSINSISITAIGGIVNDMKIGYVDGSVITADTDIDVSIHLAEGVVSTFDDGFEDLFGDKITYEESNGVATASAPMR